MVCELACDEVPRELRSKTAAVCGSSGSVLESMGGEACNSGSDISMGELVVVVAGGKSVNSLRVDLIPCLAERVCAMVRGVSVASDDLLLAANCHVEFLK